ncbi:hypothetical protein ABT218_11350 [Streptomyces sp. NPDC001455]
MAARTSPASFVRHHVDKLGRYSFQLPDLPAGCGPLPDLDTPDDE